MPKTAILWFRRDLRLDDHPALRAAIGCCEQWIPLYIHAPHEEAPWAPGAASQWWLHWSLTSLDARLREQGSQLWVMRGDSLDCLRRVISVTGATELHWSRLYDPATRERDTRIKQALRAEGVRVESHPGSLLFEPWEIATSGNGPYRVFTPYWRRCVAALAQIEAQPAPGSLPPTPSPAPAPGSSTPAPAQPTASIDPPGIASLGLLPRIPWDETMRRTWTPGESSALRTAQHFLQDRLTPYTQRRDLPDQEGTSRLSPHLHFGEISPRRLLAMLRASAIDPLAEPAEAFVREIGWREFAHHLLYHFPHTTDEPLDARFAALPWREEGAEPLLAAWKQGVTGIPLVDAGMRQLWQTGWMHNRVRMIVASFLTKNLRLPWQVGARWFWETLVDADLASNSLGWQWSAGCGADAAPYFRIFNPVLQGERFDPKGAYVRRWCPELARMPDKYLHQPWAAPAALRTHAGVRIGVEYPAAIIDLKSSRAEALAAYEVVKARA